jgi:hypothetical protein
MIPADIDLPEHWSSIDGYLERLSEFQITRNDIVGFSEASSSISSEFIQGPADLYLELSRSKTTTIRTITCLNNIWSIESESTSIEYDASDWVEGSVVQYDNPSADPAIISANILSTLLTINSQPGSDTRPNHSFTIID